MADLDPLIRYRKFELEEKQRKLARLFEEQEMLEQNKANMIDQLRHEMQVMEDLGTIEALSTYTQYSYAVKVKVEALNAQIKNVKTRIDIAMEDIRNAFGDLKKVEITQARRLEEINRENKKKEDDFFGEVALQRHHRRMIDAEDNSESDPSIDDG